MAHPASIPGTRTRKGRMHLREGKSIKITLLCRPGAKRAIRGGDPRRGRQAAFRRRQPNYRNRAQNDRARRQDLPVYSLSTSSPVLRVASKRRLRRKACDGKTRHATIQDAKRAIWELRRKDARLGRFTGRMNAYYCRYCRQIHIGHG